MRRASFQRITEETDTRALYLRRSRVIQSLDSTVDPIARKVYSIHPIPLELRMDSINVKWLQRLLPA